MRTLSTSLLLCAALAAQTSPARGSAGADVAHDNPVVVPGHVQWHAGVAQAKAVALRTRKPILLFQLLGDLDREFC